LSAGAKVEDPPTGGDEPERSGARRSQIPPWRGKKCDDLSRKAGSNLTLLSVLGLVFSLVFIFKLVFII